MSNQTLQTQIIQVCRHYLSYFNLSGERFDNLITEGQLSIFASMIFQFKNRVIIICCTQYGKSLIVALACIVISCIFGKKVAVVAPTKDKAKIIMRYYIEHIGDHEIFYSQLEKNTRLERLRQEENKERIILKNGGGIFVISTQEKNVNKSIGAAMGEGAEMVIEDEACLITDNKNATVLRMIAGKGKEAFFCKIGNPFFSEAPYSHFKKSWDNPKYAKVFIDSDQALREGRYTQEYLDEAKDEPFFDQLCSCLFPEEDLVDQDGYYKLVASNEIKFTEDLKIDIDKPIYLGCDIGGGGDYNVYCLRRGNFAIIAGKNKSKDTMVNVTEITKLMELHKIKAENVNIDDIGIGRGVCDRLKELGHEVNSVNVGRGFEKKNDKKSKDGDVFFNLKAKLYWDGRKWIKSGGVFYKENDFNQISWIKWKQISGDRQIKIQPKDELKRKTGKSPDFAEAWMLTFYHKKIKKFDFII